MVTEVHMTAEMPWVIDGVLVYVDDVDRHYDQARQARRF
jgi:hypothetical protein